MTGFQLTALVNKSAELAPQPCGPPCSSNSSRRRNWRWWTSAPLEKARPLPQMIATCASGSRSKRRSASIRCRTRSSLKALSRSGRFKVRVAIWSRQSYSTKVSVIPLSSRLPVEPDVFETPAIVLAVRHHRQSFDLRLPAGRGAQVVDDRPGQIFLHLIVDLPGELPPLGRIGLHRLLVDYPVKFLVAIAHVIALRAADKILVERDIRVIDRGAQHVEPDRVVFLDQLGHPLRGLDRVELGVDADLFELVDQDRTRIAVDREVARRDLDREPLVRS